MSVHVCSFRHIKAYVFIYMLNLRRFCFRGSVTPTFM